jgi:GNAT superfamily N-acetyltransferase
MMLPDAPKLYTLIDGTWPASAKRALGPWMVRIDGVGGNRVSATTAEAPVTDTDIPLAEEAMKDVGQTPLFMIREGQSGLDAMLDARGYNVKDVTNMYAVPINVIAVKRPPPVTAFEVWPLLAAQREVWAQGGVGEGRIDVMERARPPKTTLMGRIDDTPAATAFVAMAADCAMIHALEVASEHRRKGLARHLTCAAAFWAKDQGADYLTLLTTQANVQANALYTSLGMTLVGQYHYRILQE